MTDNTPTPIEEIKKPWISDGVYDFLRANVEFVLPAFAVAYAGLALLWGWPLSAEITGTVGVIGVFIGVVIKTNQGRAREVVKAEQLQESIVKAELDADRIAGDIVLGTGDESLGLVTLALDKPIEDFEHREEIALRVKHITTPGVG